MAQNKTMRGVQIALVVALGVAVGLGLATASRGARKAARESPQRSILSQAEGLLADYHREHGHYPETLEELPFRFTGDGQPKTLKLFQYQSDGEHYALITRSVATGEELKSCK